MQIQLLRFPLASVCSVGALLQTSCARTVCYQPEYPPVLVHLQRNLTEYFVAVDINNMLQLYASMLHERRIIITSSKLSTVSPSDAPQTLGLCAAMCFSFFNSSRGGAFSHRVCTCGAVDVFVWSSNTLVIKYVAEA